jgi:hypothetical protein
VPTFARAIAKQLSTVPTPHAQTHKDIEREAHSAISRDQLLTALSVSLLQLMKKLQQLGDYIPGEDEQEAPAKKVRRSEGGEDEQERPKGKTEEEEEEDEV